MQERCCSHGTDKTTQVSLDELFGTLWAISVITRRMASQISAIKQTKGEPHDEQNVRTVRRRRGAPQVR